MNDTFKRYLLSSTSSFATGALISVAAQIQSSGTIEWTGAFWLGILIAAVRAGVKAVVEAYAGRHAD